MSEGKKISRIEDMPIIPEDAYIIRASGDVPCSICGNLYREHERFAYPSLMNCVVKACQGDYDRECYLHL